MTPDFSQLKIEEIEDWLRQKLPFVDFIGQLPLEKDHYTSLCELIQKRFVFGKTLLIQNVPPALFISSMVFTARYSELNARNFWKPYGELVWKQTDISKTHYYNELREKFNKSINVLEREYDLIFPQRSEGDVVRPIYRHAIIPYYLQDYFTNWIKSQWREILQIPPGELISQLRLDSSYRYLPPILKSFIEGVDTEETAQELLITMATAASIYVNGESPANIDSQLSSNPIYRALWNELLKIYQEQEIVTKAKRIEPVFEWVWSLEAHEMVLRVRNLFIQSKEQPDRLVWAYRDQNPQHASVETRLLPWNTKDGWLIDIAYIGPGPLDGQIVLLGEHGSVIEAYPVPKLPTDQPIMIFRLTQQNVYGVPVDLSSNLITDGLWIVSMANHVKILDEFSREILPIESRPVPTPLDSLGHRVAGVYELKLPLTVKRRELVLARLEKRKQTGGKPHILGLKNGTIPNLSLDVPPAFNKPDIWLVVPGVPHYVIRRGTLWLRNATSTFMHPLSTLITNGLAKLTDNDIQISLGALIADQIATYTVQIIIGLQSLFASPLQFSFLPNVKIIPPNSEEVYSPRRLPKCNIEGLELKNVKGRPDTTIKQNHDNSIIVTWSDLRDDPQLQIQANDERILLSWKTQRTTAWLSPQKDSYLLDGFKNCELRVLSTARSINNFSLWIDGDSQRRKIQLNAKGEYSTKIKNDPVYDLIREKPASNVNLSIGIGQTEWVLGEVIKKVNLEAAEVRIRNLDNETILEFSCGLEQTWPGVTEFICTPFLDSHREFVLGKTDYLSKQLSFSCDLPNGFYQFQIRHEGKSLLSTPLIFSIGGDIDAHSMDFMGLHPFLVDRSVESPLPFELQRDFVSFIVTSFATGGLSDYPELFYRLLLLPFRAFNIKYMEFLSGLSPALRGFLDANLNNLSNREDGFFPAWLVMGSSLNFRLILPVRSFSVRVFPLLAKMKAESGIGYTYLRVRGDDEEADRIYFKWDIRSNEDRFNILMGLPDIPDPKTYSDLDELDVWPLKQCQDCGFLIVTRRTAKDEYLYEAHKHGNNKPKLVDIIYDYDLIAQTLSNPAKDELKYNYIEQPANWINRRSAIAIANDSWRYKIPLSINPISPENYLYVIRCLKDKISSSDKDYIDEWLMARKWQENFNQIESLIVNNPVKVPAFGPANRILAFMKNDGGFEWIKLDKQFFILSLLLRGHAHHQSQILKLLSETSLSRADLVEMVELANEISPELLGWGLAWAETLYLHALN